MGLGIRLVGVALPPPLSRESRHNTKMVHPSMHCCAVVVLSNRGPASTACQAVSHSIATAILSSTGLCRAAGAGHTSQTTMLMQGTVVQVEC